MFFPGMQMWMNFCATESYKARAVNWWTGVLKLQLLTRFACRILECWKAVVCFFIFTLSLQCTSLFTFSGNLAEVWSRKDSIRSSNSLLDANLPISALRVHQVLCSLQGHLAVWCGIYHSSQPFQYQTNQYSGKDNCGGTQVRRPWNAAFGFWTRLLDDYAQK